MIAMQAEHILNIKYLKKIKLSWRVCVVIYMCHCGMYKVTFTLPGIRTPRTLAVGPACSCDFGIKLHVVRGTSDVISPSVISLFTKPIGNEISLSEFEHLTPANILSALDTIQHALDMSL